MVSCRMTARGPKIPQNITSTFFNTVDLLRNTLGSKMGAPTMRLAQGYLEFLDIPVLAPGAM